MVLMRLLSRLLTLLVILTMPLFLARLTLIPIKSFFFQAEDGIRDVAVTGVQTCALPISRGDPRRPVRARGRRIRRRRIPPRGAPFGARAGGVRRAGSGGPALAHEPRRDALDRAGRPGGVERRRPAPAAFERAPSASPSPRPP